MADNPPSEKIFVGDTPVGADEALIWDIFGAYGPIADCKVLPARTPDSKGAALVRFESVEIAQWVVDNVNGNIPEGMREPVYITFAKTGSSRVGACGSYGKASGTGGNSASSAPYEFHDKWHPPPSEKLFVGDVPVGMDELSFKQAMGTYGTVVDVKLLPAWAPGEKGSALVRFATVDQARWMVENMNGNIPEGLDEALYISFARNTGRGWPSGDGGTIAASNAKAAAMGPFAAVLRNARAAASKGSCVGAGISPPIATRGDYGPSNNDIAAVVRSVCRSGVLPGSGQKPDGNTIQVTNLPANTADLDLYKIFAPFGAVAVYGVKAMLGADGSCRGIGFVDYVDPACAALACMTLNNTALPDGSKLCVQMRPPSRPKHNGS